MLVAAIGAGGRGVVIATCRPGGFVAGVSGEQYALPEAVERLREIRRTNPGGIVVTISAADPLNLSGIVTAGERIRVAARTRIAYRDGVPLAVTEGGIVRQLTGSSVPARGGSEPCGQQQRPF